jgi:flagellar P-ring protein precursor FlgI
MLRTRLKVFALAALVAVPVASAAVRIKDLVRFEGVHDHAVLGYGIVVGLSGSGDSSRNFVTQQSVSNMLREFGVNVPATSLNSRNTAAVIVTADLRGAVRRGDRVDINVAALGDARSLAGGTLLVTPLLGIDRHTYALAQGALSVSGFRYEQSGSIEQKNHPTAGVIPEGAIIEREIEPPHPDSNGSLDLILNEPDFTTARRVAAAINARLPSAGAQALDAGRVRLGSVPSDPAAVVDVVASIETLSVEPDVSARVIVNERTGTIVSGGNVSLSAVTVTQGDIRVSIQERYLVSQPNGYGYTGFPSPGIRTAVVPEATIGVKEAEAQSVELGEGATIMDLVRALKAIRASSRDVIAILQGIKRAGALHAELVIQ